MATAERASPVLAATSEATASRAPGRITVDGDLGEWAQSRAIEIRSGDLDPRPGARAAWTGPEDCGASLMLAWDEGCLYLAGRIDDDRLVVHPGSLYLGDCVEVFLRVPAAGGAEDYQILLSPMAEQTRWELARAVGDAAGAQAVFDAGDDTSTGSTWEAFSLDSLDAAFDG